MNPRGATHILTGTRIRERRLALSRRQADVAREVGISPAYLNLIEHNRRPVGADLVTRLAEVLQVPADELASGRQEARISALREAAARAPSPAGDAAPEVAQAPEFLARFPGWAGAMIATGRRADALERQLVNLSDRMTQDPYLLTTLHEVLSAVTSLRSTASILADEREIPDEWRHRFHANLAEDSLRLSTTAQALVAYLDSFEAEGGIFTPQEEVEGWMAAGMAPIDEAPDLASDAARALARDHLARMQAEQAALPDAALAGAAAGGDPLRISARLDAPLDLVMRRLAALRPAGFETAGLLVCDGSGALTLRRPAPGFPLPRPGDACPLWPLFQALAAPQTAISARVRTPQGDEFVTLSYATRSQPQGIDGPVLTRAQMLIQPAETAAVTGGPLINIGPSCRICPRSDCAARREPSILSPL
ncbi:short-chain fatty acyl-CoA regulator family protein [Paracoccus sp. (in: a-proteobacteria)]|uniref:short-chain fatty acyl-CoA regulator family protein n=1 Tax=Paracoccus sp. TaxID=267 RepID=UPI003A89388D